MQSIIPLCLLCVVVLQQIIDATSTASIQPNSTTVFKRLPVAGRLRAPLMGRSVPTTDNIPYQMTPSDENESIQSDKRRVGITLFSRQRWMGPRRKGPLFG